MPEQVQQPAVEMEGKGLDYERFALNKLFAKLVRTRGIKSVLEIPAKGEKAMPSIYSLAFGQLGCDVGPLRPSPVPSATCRLKNRSCRDWPRGGAKRSSRTTTS